MPANRPSKDLSALALVLLPLCCSSAASIHCSFLSAPPAPIVSPSLSRFLLLLLYHARIPPSSILLVLRLSCSAPFDSCLVFLFGFRTSGMELCLLARAHVHLRSNQSWRTQFNEPLTHDQLAMDSAKGFDSES